MSTYDRAPTTFVELLAPFPDGIREIPSALHAVIRTVAPDADETVYGGLKIANVLCSIARPTNVICGIQPSETHCKLFLHQVKPGDIAGVRLEGSGKNVRHVKVLSTDQARSGELRSALERARDGAGPP